MSRTTFLKKQKYGEKQMNERVIKIAYAVAIIILLLIAAIFAAG